MISGKPNNPSLERDPALSGTLLGAFNFAINKIIQGLDGRLPASIVSYNRTTNLAEIQILIPYVTTGGDIVPRAQIAAVPVQIDGGGGIFISFPLQPGDLGWIEACDRDISLFLQTYTVTQPNSFRKWSFSDGKFTPSVMKGYTILPQDNGALVISTLDNTVKIAISETQGITITAPVVTVAGGLVVTGDITGPEESAGTLTFKGNLVVTQSLTVGNGSLTTQLLVNGNGVATGTFSPT
jgi:hypothetical protein